MRTRVHGVDFSGAADAGRRIWVASGEVTGARLRIDACRPAAALPGGGRGREEALAALRAFVAREGEAVFGLDFPFTLPLALVSEPGWEAFALGFGERHAGPLAFRRACWEAAGGRELWRQTDREAKTPFTATNLRLCRQTFYGIRDLLAPLVRRGHAAVLPMQPARPGTAWLLEICPAATLKRWGLYAPYKGLGRRESRVRILAALTAGSISLSPDWKPCCSTTLAATRWTRSWPRRPRPRCSGGRSLCGHRGIGIDGKDTSTSRRGEGGFWGTGFDRFRA